MMRGTPDPYSSTSLYVSWHATQFRIVSPISPITCTGVAPDAAASAMPSNPFRAPPLIAPPAAVSVAFIPGGISLSGVPRRPRAAASAATAFMSPSARSAEIACTDPRNSRICPRINARSAAVRTAASRVS